MSTESAQHRHIDFIVHLQAAVRTVRLYPVSSPLIVTAVQTMLADIDGILEKQDIFVLAESENNLIVDGKPLDKKNQTRDQATALLQSFRALGIKSLSFSRGVTEEELRQVITLLGEDPRELVGEALTNRLNRMQTPHVEINQKVFVAVDRDSRIMPSLQIRDEDIARYFSGDETPTEEVLQKMRSLAENPRWIADVFATGLERLATRLGPAPNARLSSSVGQLLKAMDRLIDQGNWQEITENLAARVSQLDVEAIVAVSLQNTDARQWELFFRSLTEHLDEKKFHALTARLESISSTEMPGSSASASKSAAVGAALKLLKHSLRNRRPAREKADVPTKEKATRFTENFKDGLSRILAGDYTPLRDAQTCAKMGRLVHVLQKRGKNSAAGRIVDSLLQGLDQAPGEMQPAVVDVLHAITQAPNGDPLLAAAVEKQLRQWFQHQEELSPAFERLCRRLTEDPRCRETDGDFFRATESLQALASAADNPRATPELRAWSRNALAQVADDRVRRRLLTEIETNGEGGRGAAARILACLGPVCVPEALDILRNSPDAKVRVRILKLVVAIGAPAAPAVRRALEPDIPWYFVRNLVRLLGEIGEERDVELLAPLLDHPEFRVRWQALNSIYQVGGEQRGELLLRRLEHEEDRMKIHIVTMLGELRHREAVPALVRLLEKKAIVNSEEKVLLQKKACSALARIGSPLAIPILSEIAKGGKLTRIRPYPSAVRETARRSLQRLQMSCH